MTDRDLATLLRELDAELDKPHDLDDATRALVSTVRADLGRVLASGDTHAAAAHEGTLREQLSAALVEFERTHPSIVETTQRVLNQLANLGV